MEALDADAFDFWIGDWDCAFDGGHAVNRITREFGDRVLVERFAMDAPRAWNGLSVSVYDAASATWRQTWVDDTGNYWAFVGGLVDGDPSFGTPGPVDADPHWKRMVFSDITADAFHWRWEQSPDGDAWTVTWEIDYARR